MWIFFTQNFLWLSDTTEVNATFSEKKEDCWYLLCMPRNLHKRPSRHHGGTSAIHHVPYPTLCHGFQTSEFRYCYISADAVWYILPSVNIWPYHRHCFSIPRFKTLSKLQVHHGSKLSSWKNLTQRSNSRFCTRIAGPGVHQWLGYWRGRFAQCSILR